MMKIEINPVMKEISEFFSDFQYEWYFVGGCVRDLIMGIQPHDYDLITSALPEETQRYIQSKKKKLWLQGKRFGTIGYKMGGMTIEITTYRKEIYDFVSRKPKVEFSDKLTDDLGRRDFTINAIVCDKDGNVKNYLSSLDDLNSGIVKAVGISSLRFKEDPLRILRFFRMLSKFGFKEDPITLKKAVEHKWHLIRISKERIVEEFEKAFNLEPDKLYKFINYMFQFGIFEVIFPEMQLQYNYLQNNPHHDFALHIHTMNVVKNVAEAYHESEYIWAALFHDVGKPFTKTVKPIEGWFNFINHDIVGAEITDAWMIKNKFSNVQREFVVNSIKNHLNKDSWLKSYDDRGKLEERK